MLKQIKPTLVAVKYIDEAKYEHKDLYKAAGARWNPKRKEWYVLANVCGPIDALKSLAYSNTVIVKLVDDEYTYDELCKAHQDDVFLEEREKRLASVRIV